MSAGKQRYEERRRLRAERLLREEQESGQRRSRTVSSEETEEIMMDFLDSIDRIASALEALAERGRP